MKKIIRLTESDLTRIVKRVIKEEKFSELDINHFMDFIEDYVEDNGGGVPFRTPEEVMETLDRLENEFNQALNAVKSNTQSMMGLRNTNWGNEEFRNMDRSGRKSKFLRRLGVG